MQMGEMQSGMQIDMRNGMQSGMQYGMQDGMQSGIQNGMQSPGDFSQMQMPGTNPRTLNPDQLQFGSDPSMQIGLGGIGSQSLPAATGSSSQSTTNPQLHHVEQQLSLVQQQQAQREQQVLTLRSQLSTAEQRTQDLQRVIAQTMQNPQFATPVQMQEAQQAQAMLGQLQSPESQQWVAQTNEQIAQLQQEYVHASKVVEQLNSDSRVLKAQTLAPGKLLEITVDDEEWWEDGDSPAREKQTWGNLHDAGPRQKGGGRKKDTFHEPERSIFAGFGSF
jgi:hypothetical protein